MYNFQLFKNNIIEKFNDDLLLGIEHTKQLSNKNIKLSFNSNNIRKSHSSNSHSQRTKESNLQRINEIKESSITNSKNNKEKLLINTVNLPLSPININNSKKNKEKLLINPVNLPLSPTSINNSINKFNEFINNHIKIETVLNDPKFGMLSLFKYQYNTIYNNNPLLKDNIFSSLHIFSIYLGLPILIYICQWLILFSLLFRINNNENICVLETDFDLNKKILMLSISVVYFIKSFMLIDFVTNKIKLDKTYPCVDVFCIIDTFQEFLFMYLIYILNLWIIFIETDLLNMIFNSIAMEFIMELDNEFQKIYFNILPSAAYDIYDNLFVELNNSIIMHNNKLKESKSFNLFKKIAYIPFKILLFLFIITPIVSFSFIFISTLCK